MMKKIIVKNGSQIILLILLTFLVYANSLPNDFVSDDKLVIESGKQIRNFSLTFSDPVAFMRPLILWIIFTLFGPVPLYFRFFNISIHALNTTLVYFVVSKINSKKVGMFAATLFAVHPILTQSVTWISGGSYAQYSFFFLLTFLFYITSNNNRKFYLVSILTYLLALLSHTTAPVLSLILVIYELLFGDIKRNWKKLVPFLLLSAFWLANIVFTKVPQRLNYLQDVYHVEMKKDDVFGKDPYEINHYFGLFIWPKDLSIYPREYYLNKYGYIMGPAIFLLYLIVSIRCIKLNKKIFFWQSFFLISLIPTLTPIKLGAFAETYVYLGSVGIFATVGMLFDYLSKTKYKDLVYAVFILIIIALSVRTMVRNTDWKNEEILYRQAIKVSPYDPLARNNLGVIYFKKGMFEPAIKEFAMAANYSRLNTDAINNIGSSYASLGKCEEAIPFFKKAIEIKPEMWQSYYNMAQCYVLLNRFNEASETIRKAKEVDPSNPDFDAIIGAIYVQEGNLIEAKAILLKVLAANPNNNIARYNIERIASMEKSQ